MRRIVKIAIYGFYGFVSRLTLDSDKYDQIGFTKESLNEYMHQYILRSDEWYVIEDDIIK